MSKKSRRRNKILLAGAALFGASKLGMLGGKTAAYRCKWSEKECSKIQLKNLKYWPTSKQIRLPGD